MVQEELQGHWNNSEPVQSALRSCSPALCLLHVRAPHTPFPEYQLFSGTVSESVQKWAVVHTLSYWWWFWHKTERLSKRVFFFFFLTISLIFSLNSYCLQMWAFFCLQFASPVPKILNPVLTNQLLTFTDPETPPPGCKAGYSFSNKRVILGSKAGVFQQTQTLLSSLFFQLSEIHTISGRRQRLPRIMLYFQPPTSIYVMFPSERQILALLSTLCPGQRAIAWDSSHRRLRGTKKSLAHRALSEGSFARPGSSAACLCCLWSQQGWG